MVAAGQEIYVVRGEKLFRGRDVFKATYLIIIHNSFFKTCKLGNDQEEIIKTHFCLQNRLMHCLKIIIFDEFYKCL